MEGEGTEECLLSRIERTLEVGELMIENVSVAAVAVRVVIRVPYTR